MTEKITHTCKCGESLEDTGHKIQVKRFGKFDLLACNSCGTQALFREVTEGHYEI